MVSCCRILLCLKGMVSKKREVQVLSFGEDLGEAKC